MLGMVAQKFLGNHNDILCFTKTKKQLVSVMNTDIQITPADKNFPTFKPRLCLYSGCNA